MLETPCPISHFPLIEKDGKVFSVRCQMEVVLPNTSAGKARVSKAEVEVPGKYSRQVFRLLRLGYVLSSEKCPISGGLLFEKNGSKFSLIEDREINDNTGTGGQNNQLHNPISLTEVEKREAALANPNPDSTPTYEPPREMPLDRPDPVFDNVNLMLIAWERYKAQWIKDETTLLLRGWTMLGESCPVTNAVPLMQNQEGQKFSTAINEFVDDLTPSTAVAKRRELVKRSNSLVHMKLWRRFIH